MGESARIADLLKRASEGNAWHGPGLREVLAGVNAMRAGSHPIAGAHSIWELVLHIAVWRRVALHRLAGEPATAAGDQDWPPVHETSEASWGRALDDLEASYHELEGAIEALPDARLEECSPTDPLTLYVLLHGVVQHDLYHAGQIALLKKA